MIRLFLIVIFLLQQVRCDDLEEIQKLYAMPEGKDEEWKKDCRQKLIDILMHGKIYSDHTIFFEEWVRNVSEFAKLHYSETFDIKPMENIKNAVMDMKKKLKNDKFDERVDCNIVDNFIKVITDNIGDNQIAYIEVNNIAFNFMIERFEFLFAKFSESTTGYLPTKESFDRNWSKAVISKIYYGKSPVDKNLYYEAQKKLEMYHALYSVMEKSENLNSKNVQNFEEMYSTVKNELGRNATHKMWELLHEKDPPALEKQFDKEKEKYVYVLTKKRKTRTNDKENKTSNISKKSKKSQN